MRYLFKYISATCLLGVLDRNLPLSVFQDDLKAIAGIDSYIDSKGVLHFK